MDRFFQSTMLLVCTDDLYYKREADWVGHKIRSHPWKKLPIFC